MPFLRQGLDLNNLAGVYWAQGRYAEAEPLLQRALAIREQALGSTHLYLAQILNNLGEVYWARGRYAEAKSLYQRAFALWEQAGGPNHLEAAHSLGKAASLLAQHQQLARAHDLFERARQIYLAVSQANVDLEEEAARGVLRQQTEILQAYIDLLATMARKTGGDPTPPSAALAAFMVAEQAREGAVQMALARAGARAAATEPATATLSRQVEELRRRQACIRPFPGMPSSPPQHLSRCQRCRYCCTLTRR
jgi:tetratricopeptide (TPR) repeat protein